MQLHAALDSMRARLAPLLDADQRGRLENAARLAPPIRAGGQGRGDRPPPPATGRHHLTTAGDRLPMAAVGLAAARLQAEPPPDWPRHREDRSSQET